MSALHSLLLGMMMQEGRDCPWVFALGDFRHLKKKKGKKDENNQKL